MNDKESYKNIQETMHAIFDMCVTLAQKEGLQRSFVFQNVGAGLIVMADKFRERERDE